MPVCMYLKNVLDNSSYSDTNGTFRFLKINAYDFSTSGVFKYELLNPITNTLIRYLGYNSPNLMKAL